MIIVVVLVFAWSVFMILWLIRFSRIWLKAATRGAKTGSAGRRPALGAVYDPEAPDGPAWSALDDLQLTRLLVSAAPPPEPRSTTVP